MRQRDKSGFSVSLGNGNSKSENSVFGVNKIAPVIEDEVCHDEQGSEFVTIRGNIPTLLLRRYFESKNKWKKLQYVFCEFDHTYRSMSNGLVPFMDDMKHVLSYSSNIYGFKGDVMKSLLTDNAGYEVVKSLIYRLYKAHALMEKYKELKDYKMSFRLQLFIDTHMDLAMYMQTNDLYTNEDLLDPDSNCDDMICSAVDKYYPHAKRFIYCGDLPDLTTCIDQGNIWYDVRPKQKIDNVVSAIIHLISCKTETQKCQDRNLVRILWMYFKDFPILFQLYRLIILMSLYGNYPHARERPNFETRIEIKKSFSNPKLTERLLFLWMKENEELVYYCTKEIYMYMIEKQYALDQMKTETSHWTKIKLMIGSAMDISRSYVNRTTIQYDGYPCITKEMELNHQETLRYISKLRKGGFLDIIINNMNKYYNKYVVNKFSTSIQNSEMDLTPDLLKDMEFVVCSRYNTYVENNIQLVWLKCFGISENGYDEIRNLYYDYEYKDMADNAIIRRLKRIYDSNSHDFHIIRCYFKKIYDRKSFSVYNLSYTYAQNQLKALRTKYFIPPWENIQDDSDLFYYCTICKKWSNPVVNPITSKSRLNVYSVGLEKALFDCFSNELFCGKQSTSINIRKLMDNGDYFREGVIESQKNAKTIRKHKETAKCCDTQLQSIHMIGKLQKLNNKLWALCEICASLTQFEGAKLSKLGFTCGRHYDDEFNVNQQFQQTKISKTQSILEKLARAQRGDDLDKIRIECGLKITLDKNKEKPIEMKRCYYCERECKSSKDIMISIRVVDDSDILSLRYIKCLLCKDDFEISGDLFEDGRVPKKSDLFKRIETEKKKNTMKSIGARVFKC